ncbi:hypothetical protein GCM10022234_21800 [Aeromicrobium panaciterrae]|uniref:hypothetical protein n=1 Tax=Aeromicrobium panaciterrae TaxID=363861 RepID=UPI0031DAA6B5
MNEIQVWRSWLTAKVASELRNPKHDERGDIVQTVILTALFAAAAIAIAAIIITKFTNKANTIPTG